MNVEELARGISEAKARIASLPTDQRRELQQGFDRAEREASLISDGGRR